MANMKDIATRAGVSVATVSKVLNGLGGISQDTTETILSIAKELNYHPNLYARNLKTRQSKTIGIITEDITVFNTPPIIDGIGACCEERGYHYLLENLRLNRNGINPVLDVNDQNVVVNDAIDFMMSMQVDGLIYLSCHSHKVLHLPSIKDTHFVCTYCSCTDPFIPTILYDDRKAGYDVAKFLIKAGHKKIGVITGPSESIHATRRLNGYQEALFECGIPYNPKMTITGDWSRDSGYLLADQLVKQGATAIFSQNDIMAMGVIDYCMKNGIEIGHDLSLIGFDNREVSTVCRPTLTTVELPLFEIGQTSASTLIDRIEGKPFSISGEVLLECTIIERESTRKSQSH
ncbi:MAG TPA: LacI family DNA-binding transcriptional regulator [Lachnospiraceae bacterium]|nr:LacI family DNA-binding transcriptional regulator [Lachnospiraceae bacterium]